MNIKSIVSQFIAGGVAGIVLAGVFILSCYL